MEVGLSLIVAGLVKAFFVVDSISLLQLLPLDSWLIGAGSELDAKLYANSGLLRPMLLLLYL